MSVTKKTIDEITRTLDTVTGAERFPGRDDTGDFKVLASALYAYIRSGVTGVPVGTMIIGSFIDTPDDYLLCDGVTRSRVTYSDLWDKYHKLLGTCTISQANPGVVTLVGHGRVTGERIYLTTDGALPTGLSENTDYFVIKLTDDTFNVAASLALAEAGTGIETTSAGSGTHTCYFCPWGCGDGSTTFDLPDPRGLAIKGAGNATINTRTKVGPVFGGVQEDQMQGHQHQGGNQRWTGGQNALGSAANGFPYDTTGSPMTDGTNGTPRTGSNTRDSSIGFNFYVRYQ